jgi:hypothetical protein
VQRADEGQNSAESRARFVLRLIPAMIGMLSLNYLLLLSSCDWGSLILANFLVGFLFLLFLLALGETIDKRLLLWGFRTYKWMQRHELIEEECQEQIHD